MWLLIVFVPILIWLDFHLFRGYFKFIFNDEDDFNKSLKYSITPDIVSLFRGEYFKDRFAEFKLSMFLFLCGVTIVLEILLLRGIINIFL